MLSKTELKTIHAILIDFECNNKVLIAHVHYEYMKADPIAAHVNKTNEQPSRYDLSEDAHEMFINLKKQVDECGYSETLNEYRGIKLDNMATKIQAIKEGQMDSREYADIIEMIALADTYLMILKSPEDMFQLGEFQ